jgi:type II secretory pathway component PulC
MRQPLWAINSSLLFLVLLGQAVFFMIKMPMPRRVYLEPGAMQAVEKNITTVVDIKTIYDENDLFGTFLPRAPILPKQIDMSVPQMPDAPSAIPLTVPVEPQKVFVPPLPVVLKGVIYLHDQPSRSVAMVQFQDSKEEINYHVGQLINDAQILKILPNHIVVVRSNGQQETLYLRENDASKDLSLETAKELAGLSIVHKNGMYHIPVDKFTAQVKGLGQFIDLLDLTTVYQKGKSIGCRVGKASKDSLGAKLGFSYDDIISQVDGLPVTDIASRVLAFDNVIEKKVGDKITVHVDRSGSTVQMHYMLTKSSDRQAADFGASGAKSKEVVKSSALEKERQGYDLEEQRRKMFEQKIKMAPTAHQVEMEERRKMFAARRDSMMAKHQNTQHQIGAGA